jgi:hypothetical protein
VIGEPLALDPRVEDPMEYLMLDIAGGTFALRPSPGINATMKIRAEYTIELVKLNRDVLIRGRKEAFDNYVLRLKNFIAKRDDGSSNAQLDAVISSIRRMQHATVWNEIRRQQEDIPMLGELFEAAPEALGWQQEDSGLAYGPYATETWGQETWKPGDRRNVPAFT